MTSSYHGSKLSGSHSFLTEMAICIFERWKEIVGYRFAPSAIMYRKVIHVFFFTFFLSYLFDHGLLRSKNFATMATLSDDFSIMRLAGARSETKRFSELLISLILRHITRQAIRIFREFSE